MSTLLKRRRTWIAATGGIAAVTLALAGCGGGGSGGGSYGASAASSGGAAGSANAGGSHVALASSKLGKILVDGQGRTLYLFEADKGSTSACDGACASIWPPLKTSAKPKAGSGLSAAKLGTSKRADGSTGVTYNGHPLYTYAGDSAPGQTNGEGINGFGAEWYVLSAAGNKVEAR